MLAVGTEDPRQLMANGSLPQQKSVVGETLLENLLDASKRDAADPKIREGLLLLYDELKDILSCVTCEETRSGVVRAIVVAHTHKRAVIRLLMVKVADSTEEKPKITYLPAANEKINEQPLSAQRIALDVANKYLIEHDYPDGLAGKEIFWQMLTDQDMPPQDTRAYEGDSLSLPLCTAIISEYLNQPVASDVAMTGAFHIDSLSDGRVAPVNYIQTKVLDAIKAGIHILYIPDANKTQLDVACYKTAEEYRCSLKYVRNIDDAFSELFVKEVPPGVKQFLTDLGKTLKDFFPSRKPHEKHPKEVVPQFQKHIWFSTFLLTLLFVADWFMLVDTISFPGIVRLSIGSLLIAASILFSYTIPFQYIRRKLTTSWYISIFVTCGAVLLCGLLSIFDVPWVAKDISHSFDWPPILALWKDYFIFWLFIWIYGTNVFNVHVAYESLFLKRQFRTLQQCMRWDSRHEGNMPISCFPFPWAWGALAAAGTAVFLLIFEIQYYTSFREEFEGTSYIVTLAVARDLLFIIAAADILIFYKKAVAKIKREMFV